MRICMRNWQHVQREIGAQTVKDMVAAAAAAARGAGQAANRVSCLRHMYCTWEGSRMEGAARHVRRGAAYTHT